MSGNTDVLFQCACCGKEADGTTKPCDCVTDVGYRLTKKGIEHVVWDQPPAIDWRRAAIGLQSALVAAEAEIERLRRPAHGDCE